MIRIAFIVQQPMLRVAFATSGHVFAVLTMPIRLETTTTQLRVVK